MALDCSFVMPSLKSFAIRRASFVAPHDNNRLTASDFRSICLLPPVRIGKFGDHLHSNPPTTGVNRFFGFFMDFRAYKERNRICLVAFYGVTHPAFAPTPYHSGYCIVNEDFLKCPPASARQSRKSWASGPKSLRSCHCRPCGHRRAHLLRCPGRSWFPRR